MIPAARPLTHVVGVPHAGRVGNKRRVPTAVRRVLPTDRYGRRRAQPCSILAPRYLGTVDAVSRRQPHHRGAVGAGTVGCRRTSCRGPPSAYGAARSGDAARCGGASRC